MQDMQALTPENRAVLLRLKWRDAGGRERFTVGTLNFRGKIRLEVGLDSPMNREDFDGWKPLEQV
jgi:hypothetical protein